MKTWIKIALALLALLLLAVGYVAYQQRFFIKMALVPLRPYVPTELPEDTTQLFVVNGEWSSHDTAYLFVQGGPNYILYTEEFNALHYLPNSPHLLKVFPTQSQIYNHAVFAATPNLTEAQAEAELQVSVDMLDRTIRYAKDRVKTVVAIGHSYGSHILLEYLDTRENMADHVVLMGLNLDMDMRNIAAIDKGKVITWVDGTDPQERDPFPDVLRSTSLQDKFINMATLMKHGKKRYTQALADDDLAAVIYVYGEKDESVGRPTERELDFLREKQVRIEALEGGHMSMWSTEFMSRLDGMLREG